MAIHKKARQLSVMCARVSVLKHANTELERGNQAAVPTQLLPTRSRRRTCRAHRPAAPSSLQVCAWQKGRKSLQAAALPPASRPPPPLPTFTCQPTFKKEGSGHAISLSCPSPPKNHWMPKKFQLAFPVQPSSSPRPSPTTGPCAYISLNPPTLSPGKKGER